MYAIQSGSLYEVDPVSGECQCLPTDYKGASLMTFLDGFLYLITGETLYKVNPKDQKYVEVGKDWQDVRVLVAVPAAGK